MESPRNSLKQVCVCVFVCIEIYMYVNMYVCMYVFNMFISLRCFLIPIFYQMHGTVLCSGKV